MSRNKNGQTQIFTAICNYLNFMDNVQSSSPHTLRSYGLDLAQAFKQEISSKDWKKPPSPGPLSSPKLLTLCREALHGWGNLSLASRNRKAATLKSFLKWAYAESLIEKDLARQIHCPSVPKKLPHFISVDEVLSVLSLFKSGRMPNQKVALETQALFYLLYGGGLRVSEACELKWQHIDSSRRALVIKGKGGKERLAILPEKALKVISLLPKTGAYIWGERALSTRRAYDWIRQLGAQANLLKPLHPHALRHSFATHLLTSGASMRALQELLGHQSLTATEKYTHLGIDHLSRTLEKHHPLRKK